ncbi:HGGxSTG domain-containing protein [Bradyrhizobium sp. CCBAU 51627]|uniref:HGGxSTG domain-containing protein n=1 Tax=Bradyrhizobium sp. CCBAU 51627 TaxID=1325088 RepID=UPI002306C38B|nr:HGGxSTG domain-containing protein [Bradyrhizobium sp. CCBAU 51627]
MSHTRNTGPMRASARCGARTRNGETCRAPALRGKTRCRMHGGTAGSGAPVGNGNAVKHGYFTSEAIDERKFVRAILIQSETFLRELPAGSLTNCNPDVSGTPESAPGTDSPLPRLTNAGK